MSRFFAPSAMRMPTSRVRQNDDIAGGAEDAHRCKKEPEHADDRSDGGRKTRDEEGRGLMQHLVECGCGYDQVGIDRCDDRTDAIDEMRRIRPGPDEDRVILKAAFGKWYVDLLRVAAVQLDAACIARDSDDLVGGSIGESSSLRWN